MDRVIQLAHGGGGRLSREIVDQLIVSRFGEEALQGLPDAAALRTDRSKILFSTDSFVVQPLFFPGGNIGDLAVYGTVNDLSVSGSRPRWLSLAMILEEGFPVDRLETVLDSACAAAKRCGAAVVTGDTKVVPRGQADGLYLNTAGIGEALPGFELTPRRISAGDVILASGGLAEHGAAVMAARNGIKLAAGLGSDTGPVFPLVAALSDLADAIKFMRDPTRGGAAAALNEMVCGLTCGAEIDETAVPVNPGVRAVCEMLGFDPLHLPSEGRLLAVCRADAAETVLRRWRALPEGASAAEIGRITTEGGMTVINTAAGGRRMVDWPQGEMLPRIC